MAKKRAKGEGSIFKRSDGRWVSQAVIGGEQLHFYGKSQAEVKEKLQNALEDARKGIYIKSKITFGEWLDTWLTEYAKPQVRASTYDSYSSWINNHIKPSLGKIILKELHPSQIQKFYNKKLTGDERQDGRTGTLSVRSIRYMHTLIKACLEQALKENKIVRNPADATKPPKQTKKEAAFLSGEQLNKFFINIVGDRWFTAFITDVGSGLRRGELVALKWSNVDLDHGFISVKEGIVRVKEENRNNSNKTKLIKQPPKSEKGVRVIPLPDWVVKELKIWKERQEQEKRYFGDSYNDQGFVFAWPDGKMVRPDYFTRHFSKLIHDCGLSNLHLHNLRHSFASLLLERGENPKTVQELLGDSTITVVMDTYTHVIPEVKKRAISKLNGIIDINSAEKKDSDLTV